MREISIGIIANLLTATITYLWGRRVGRRDFLKENAHSAVFSFESSLAIFQSGSFSKERFQTLENSWISAKSALRLLPKHLQTKIKATEFIMFGDVCVSESSKGDNTSQSALRGRQTDLLHRANELLTKLK